VKAKQIWWEEKKNLEEEQRLDFKCKNGTEVAFRRGESNPKCQLIVMTLSGSVPHTTSEFSGRFGHASQMH
jgi:hypothetical protein